MSWRVVVVTGVAKVYFNGLFGMEFTRSADTVTNSALNYGYALLLSVFNREISGIISRAL